MVGEAEQLDSLLAAVDCLVTSGELREELLPWLWQSTGLRRADYGAVLETLCRSGMLFLAQHTPRGRKWIVPIRLREDKPGAAVALWREALRGGEQLSLVYTLGAVAPPGLAERLMAACFGFGEYRTYWKRGAHRD